ncbi:MULTISPECIES: hypothetical protein [Legionella]|uniref:Uncharacterized protein n=1 Tax=Legionella resiliens TaxID=2905958 RepID=A0ABS8X3M3_9GAMM|nr:MULTISPECIES: hypothetical protein [unclassified Legionella]MCE0722565.1 hypothetical protein [Legionella sp. 9fVS26]MCE3531718.1 hypothetical protein [Legionella sp. 8cVS16]QLZ67744.1 hypothetical protein FOLKNPGA_00517 [Legionella sp. PC1000]
MSHVLDLYKRYKSLLLDLDVALDNLDRLAKDNAKFISNENNYFENYKTSELQLLGLPLKLKGLDEELEKINTKLGNPDLDSAEREKLLEAKQEKNKQISSIKNEIKQYQIRAPEIAEQVPWKAKKQQLTTEYLSAHGADPERFHKYMNCYHAFSKISMELENIQGDLDVALRLANSEEKKEATAWSKINLIPLRQKIFAKENQPKYKGAFISSLYDKYQATCMEHANYLKKPELIEKVQQGKISLSKLEGLVAIRKEKQDFYRSLLPDYVVTEISPDTHIQGKRTLGILKTDTEAKVRTICSFLNTHLLEANQQTDKEKMKELFADIKVHFNDSQISRIYNEAKQKQSAVEVEQIFDQLSNL